MDGPRAGNDDRLLEALDFKTYGVAEAARLVHIHPRRTSRWLQGYVYEYEVQPGRFKRTQQAPVVRREATEGTIYASFLDLIDLLFVKQFLDHGISLQRIRLAFDEASLVLNTNHFARQTFFTDGRSIYLRLAEFGPDRAEGIMQLMSGGQWTIAPIIEELASRIDFHEATGLARRWFPMGREGHVVVDPLIAFGRPSLFRRGVATENVYDFFIGEGEELHRVAGAFPFPPDELMAAVHFEHELAA